MSTTESSRDEQFAELASNKRASFIAEYLYLLKQSKKYWMLPLILILLAFGLLMMVSSTGFAPFIYALF